jgi:TolA-binding protein
VQTHQNHTNHSTAVALLGLLCLGMPLVPCNTSLGSDQATKRYFEQLRQRHLFSVAEGECLRRLAAEEISPDERLDLTLELSRTCVAHAHESSGKQQEQYWQRAETALQRFLENQPNHPQRILLQTQAAFVKASRGETIRWLSELQPHDDSLRSLGLQTLETAINQLEVLEKELTNSTRPSGGRRTETSQGVSPSELRTLLLNVRYHIGAAQLNRANLHRPQSPDRVEALIRADEWLEQVAGGASGEDLTQKARLLLAKSHRMQGDLRRATSGLNALEKGTLSNNLRNRVVAEKARVLLASDSPADAAQLLLEYRQTGAWPSGEVSFLNAQAIGALWKIAEDNDATELTTELMEKMEAHVRYAERDVGGYWGYRCQLFLNEIRSTQKYGAAVAAAVERAKSLYAAGRIDESIAAYAVAEKTARDVGQQDFAMDLGYTGASILCQKARFEQAAQAFHKLTELYSNSNRVANAHLLWAYCLGKLGEQQPVTANRQDYAAALNEHLGRFPETQTAIEATWMLARLKESQSKYREAAELYGETVETQKYGLFAQLALARCYEALIDQLTTAGQPANETRIHAISHLGAILEKQTSGTNNTSLQRAETALRLARMILNAARPDFRMADHALKRVFAIWTAAKQAWATESARDEGPAQSVRQSWQTLISAATQLNIISLAGQRRMHEAEALVKSLAEDAPEEVLAVLDGLTLIAVQADPSTQRRLASLQLEAAATLVSRHGELEPAQQRRLDLCRAQAFAAVSYLEKSIEIYERLVQQAPSDRSLLKTLTELLLKSDDREHLKRAKSNWRKLEATETPGSVIWLTYRYSVASCCFQLHEYDECAKLLHITRVLYPHLGNEMLKAKFEKLRLDLDRSR